MKDLNILKDIKVRQQLKPIIQENLHENLINEDFA